jgi:hypothetical protein
MNLLRLREIWRIEGLDNKLLVAGCWSLVGTDNGYAHISKARCPPQRASALAGDPGCGAPGRIRAGSPSVLHPTLRKSAKDGAPELFTSHPSHKTRRMRHPSFLHPTLRTKREGWGTRAFYIPLFAQNAKDGAPAAMHGAPSKKTEADSLRE